MFLTFVLAVRAGCVREPRQVERDSVSGGDDGQRAVSQTDGQLLAVPLPPDGRAVCQ